MCLNIRVWKHGDVVTRDGSCFERLTTNYAFELQSYLSKPVLAQCFGLWGIGPIKNAPCGSLWGYTLHSVKYKTLKVK